MPCKTSSGSWPKCVNRCRHRSRCSRAVSLASLPRRGSPSRTSLRPAACSSWCCCWPRPRCLRVVEVDSAFSARLHQSALAPANEVDAVLQRYSVRNTEEGLQRVGEVVALGS
eukprot:4817980-Pyramimonas_sp.AAC.1